MGILFKRKKGVSEEKKFISSQNDKITSSDLTAGDIPDPTDIEQTSTKQKNIEEELLRSKKIAEKYLDLAAGIIIALDNKGNVTLLNRMGCEITGYHHDEIIGKNWFDLCLKPEIVPGIKEVFSKIMKGEVSQVKYYENEIVTKSGETRMIAWHNTILKDDDGNISEVLSSGMDISSIKKIENELKKAKEILKEEVDKKTEQLRLRVSELERFFDATVERELRMRDLQDELKDLKRENIILVEQIGKKTGGLMENRRMNEDERRKNLEDRRKEKKIISENNKRSGKSDRRINEEDRRKKEK